MNIIFCFYTYIFITLLFLSFPFSTSYGQDLTVHYHQKMIIKDDPPHYLLGYIKDVQIDKDGSIYLFNLLPPQVIKLDNEGNYIRTIIKEGKGPGEIIRVSSAFLNKNTNEILVADRKNLRLIVTDLKGKEKREMFIKPNKMDTPEEIKLYQGNKYILLFSVGKSQTFRSNKNGDTYFHVFNLNEMKLLYSFGDRKLILNKLDYSSKGAPHLTNFDIGDVLYVNKHTLLYAPRVYNGVILKFKKTGPGKWQFKSKIKGRHWDRPGFKDTYYNKNGRLPQKDINRSRNTATIAGPWGYIKGLLNIRSAGFFRLNKNILVHFSVGDLKSKSGKSFYQKLYAEFFDNQFNFLGSKMLTKTNNGGIIINVYTKGQENNFYLGLQTSKFHAEVIKFSLDIQK